MHTVTGYSRQYLWLLAVPLLVFGLWAEWQTFFSLWYDSIIYNHGFLVLAGTLFLLYLRRESLAELRVNASPLALFLLAGASVVLLLSQAADIRVFRLLLVPLLIIIWGWSIWGKGFLKTAGGPIMLLIFGVPIWDDLSPLLQHITVFFNEIFLQIADIDATIKEFYIILKVGAFVVENGCSGVRYLMVGLFLASFYGQLHYRSHTPTVLLVLIAALLSMLANWIRVFGIIAAGHYTNMETSLVEDHELFGWVIFVIFTLVPLFYISAKLDKPSEQTEDTPATTVRATPIRSSIAWPVIASLLLLWPSLMPLAVHAKTERLALAWNPTLPETVPGWRGPLRHANIWHPDYQKPDIDIGGVYVSDDLQQVQLQIIGYRLQTQNKELIYYRNRIFDADEWALVSQTTHELNTAYSTGLERVNETIIRRPADGEQIIIWSWYDIGDTLTDSRIKAKVTGALKKITGDSRGALWAVAGRCEGNNIADCDRQRDAFGQFLESAGL
ncbi:MULTISPECIES: exosortase A [Marinobacter]|uniref:exosortase A n=3 Tax=Marinobacteraceae TaxID=2887365 RepID=UPI002942E0B4|nr:exosortase A [Marinobacter salarius]WOI17677.1 EpsI family protein [Marinobacter salarius]